MTETQLFVYGTLRHDQPEHPQFCRGVTRWQPARVRGRLTRIPEGYLLLEVAPSSILQRASSDAAADEARLGLIDPSSVAQAAAVLAGDNLPWIDGELLTFADAGEAWPQLDAWEGFRPEQDTVYQRCVIPVHVNDTILPGWAYVTPHFSPASKT